MSVNASVIAGTPASLVSDWRSAASLIDHTLLKPEATSREVTALCDEAIHYGFHAIVGVDLGDQWSNECAWVWRGRRRPKDSRG